LQIASSLLVDLNLERPGVIDQLRGELAVTRVVQGRVLSEQAPGRYLVALGNQRMTFIPTRPLEVGASFTARMISGRLVLDFPSLSGTPSTAETTPSAQVTVQSLPELLADLGLPASDRHVAALESLLRAGVSLNADAIRMVAQYASPKDSSDATLLGFLIRKGIPVDSGLLMALDGFLQKKEELGPKLQDLLVRLESLAQKTAGLPAGNTLGMLLLRLKSALPRVSLTASEEQWLDTIRGAVSRSGIFREAGLALLGHSAGGVETVRLEDLKSILLNLLSEMEMLTGIEKERKEISQPLRDLITSVEQSQLASVKAPWDKRQVWFLEVPFWFDNQLQSFRMTIEGESPEEGREMKPPLRVDMYLDLSILGRLRVILTLLQQGVEGRILSDRPDVIDLMKTVLPDWLKKRQEETGEEFPLRYLQAQVCHHPKELTPPDWIDDSIVRGPGGELGRVDVEV